MNTRKYKLVEMIFDKLETMTISDDQLIVIRLPSGVDSKTSQMVGQSIVDALRAINKNNSVILLPYDIQIHNLDEKDMKELGWVKDDKATECNPTNSGLQEFATCANIAMPIDEQHRIWQSQVTELLGKLQDTKPDQPRIDPRNYINPSVL